MKYALGNMLNGGIQGLDPDAKAYINAVVAAGATVTATQRNAINAFVKVGKADGWWTSMKRLYLPIWAIAAPNAIDVVGGTSGTFVGTGAVTHSAGFVQGNGSTGYFSSDTSATAVGMTTTSGLAGVIVYQADTRNSLKCLLGTRNNDSSGSVLIYQTDSSNLQGAIGRSIGSEPSSFLANTPNGVILVNRNSTDLQIHRRNSSAFTSGGANAIVAAPVTNVNQRFMALWEAAPFFHTNAKIGAMFMGTGLTDALAETLSLRLKTLWETCTTLTLP